MNHPGRFLPDLLRMNVFKITFAENWIQLRKISYCIQMKKTTITAVFIILVITGLFPVHALATPSSYVRTNADGLSNSSITCMYQDSLDRLWIGTWDGLNVYDSHEFWVWQHEPDDDNTISNNVIRGIAEQDGGIMWIATDYGINRINTRNSSVERFYLGYEHRNPTEEKTFSIAVSDEGEVFCAAKDWGIAFYNSTSGRMEAVNIPGISTSDIAGIYCGGKGRLILISVNGSAALVRYTFPEPGKIDIIEKSDMLPGTTIYCLSVCRDILYMLTTDNEMLRYDTVTSTFTDRIHVPVKGKVKAVAELGGGRVALGFDSRGVCTLEPDTGALDWIPELSDINIFSMYYGSQDILWIGTDGQGLWAFYEDPFKMDKMTYLQMSGTSTRYPVRTFYKDNMGNLFTGTKGNGILVTRGGKRVRSYSTSDGLGNNSVYALTGWEDGDILVGHDGKGINVISGKTGAVSRIIPDKDNDFGSVYNFLKDDTTGYLWMGTSGYGLVKAKIEKTSGEYRISDIRKYTSNPKEYTSINNNVVQALVQEGDSVLWVGTRGGGLNRLDLRTGNFTHYTVDTGDNPISSNDILSLHISRNGTLWAGTSYGLNRLVSYSDGACSFKSITTRDGLHNNTIHGIEEDHAGKLWLGTSQGLSVYEPNSGKITNYYNDDKLQDNEYSDGACYADDSGLLYFGGINGFNWFNPESIQPRSFEPEVLISRVTLSQDPDTDIMDNSGTITLRHNENFFNIYFTALEYINNSNCEYSYILEGFSGDWVQAGTSHSASFTNVPPGKYTFKVRSTNGDKVWSGKTTSIKIRIMPPWWATVWAYIAYTIIIVVAIFLIQTAINMRMKQKHRLELESLKRRQLAQTYEAKLRFFTNIAHEFTTPLTLICGPIEQIMNEYKLPAKVEKYNRIILNNAERMLRLIQELIEFRKADTGNQKPQYSKVDLTEMIMTIIDNFSEMKEEKQITMETSIGQGMSVVTDHNSMEKILYNLISNAYKYTPDGGNISICAGTGPDGITISVKNSGKGIKPEHLGQVFDRFVILDNYEYRASKGKTLRNGIGMALVSSLVKMLSGEIKVASEQGKYTMFTVTLPHVGEEMASTTAAPDMRQDIKPAAELLQEEDERLQSNTQQANGKKSIMVVDDEAQIRDLVTDILGYEYRIIQARDGKDALEKLKDGIPDLVISDLNMPNMNGTELLKHLKANEITKFIPVIFLAFKTDIGEEIETYEMGSEVFIPKPFYPKHLKAVVHRILDSRSMLKDYYNSAISSSDIYDGTTVDAEDKKFLMQMTAIIEENITDENLSPNMICEKMATSRMQLYRKLKELTQQTPSEFIRNIKLEHAAHLLKTTKLTVQEVMFSSGFNNKSYFYREFAGKYMMSPKEYRKGNQ